LYERKRELRAWALGFQTVQRWMGKETIRSERTRRMYLDYLVLVSERLGRNPDEIVADRVKDFAEQDFVKRERLEDEIRKIRDAVAKESESNAFSMVATICSFLKANTGSRLNITNAQPDTKYEVWQYSGEPAEEQAFWQRIVDHAPSIRDASLFLMGLETGARDGSVLAMTIADVAADFERAKAPYTVRIPPPGSSPKKKSGGTNFIAEDTRKKVEAYLALRKARGFSCVSTDRFVVDMETGKPIEAIDVLNDALRHAFLDAGALSHDQVYPPDARMSPVRWYTLRKRCQTVMEDNRDGTGIALNWVDVMMCHKPRGAQGSKYSRPSPQQLREAYAKAMHRVEIYRAVKPEASKAETRRQLMAEMERIASELQKLETRTVTGSELARILRNLATVEPEAKSLEKNA
jgi:integrase